MASRGVHFSLSSDQLLKLLATSNDDEVMSVIEELEDAWDQEFLAESDKAWSAIHRCLTDGSLLFDGGEYPLNLVICGGRQMFKGDEYTISLVMPEQVKDVAIALSPVNQEWMRERYFSLLKSDDYEGEIGEADFQYTWDWFEDVQRLYFNAAAAERAAIFTVDA